MKSSPAKRTRRARRFGSSPSLLVAFGAIWLANAIGVYFSYVVVVMWATIALEFCVFLYGIRNRPAGLLLSFFVIATFTFLTGRMFVVGVLGYKSAGDGDWGLHFNDPDIVVKVLIMQQVFVAFCWLGTYLQVRRKVHLDDKTDLTVENRSAVSIGVLCVTVGAAIYLYERVGVVSAVNQASYLDYYAARASLVSPLARLSESLLVVGYGYTLAGRPRFQTFAFVSFLLLASHGYDLLMGRRAPFVLSLLLVLFYATLRTKSSPDKKDQYWPRASHLAVSTFAFIPLISLLNYINFSRSDAGSTTSSPTASALTEFFYSQGVSANLLMYVQTDVLQIPQNKIYTFGPLIEFAQTRLVPGFDSSIYDGQTADRALLGYNFADIASYRIMPSIYLNGGGYGSSAVAELFWDFGWVGVALGGLALGAVFAFGGRILESSVPLAAIALIVSRQVLYAPRAPFLDWLVGSANVFNVLVFLFVLCWWKFSEQSNRDSSRTGGSNSTSMRGASTTVL